VCQQIYDGCLENFFFFFFGKEKKNLFAVHLKEERTMISLSYFIIEQGERIKMRWLGIG
jgi:hypothetical protein